MNPLCISITPQTGRFDDAIKHSEEILQQGIFSSKLNEAKEIPLFVFCFCFELSEYYSNEV